MKRLLIVDDNKLMRDTVAACLRPLGAVLFEFATTGMEAMDRLARAGLDLLVLDLPLTGGSGVALVDYVHSLARLRDLPILIVAPHDDRERVAPLLRPGTVEMVSKPLAPGEIIDEVRRLLQRAPAAG